MALVEINSGGSGVPALDGATVIMEKVSAYNLVVMPKMELVFFYIHSLYKKRELV